MIQYPKYREGKVYPPNTYLKADIDELMAIWDWLTDFGFYVVPKEMANKKPLTKYWSNKGKITDRAEVRRDQLRSDVSGWCIITGERSANLCVVDFDTQDIIKHGGDPEAVLALVNGMSPSAFAFGTPSGGLHLFYLIPDDWPLLRDVDPPADGVDIRCEGGQVLSLGAFTQYLNTEKRNYADDKGVPDGHIDTYYELDDADYESVPMMTRELYDWIMSEKEYADKPENDTPRQAKQRKSREGQLRTTPLEDRVALVKELLEVILPHWGYRSYAEWFQMWASAYQGSGGDTSIRDLIAFHDGVTKWKKADRLAFKEIWDKHEHREDGGYTMHYLMREARKYGWQQRSGYDLSIDEVETFDDQWVSDWLLRQTKERLTRVLMQSQTGSGKTRAFKQLWELLDKPKSVIFVPTTKLAVELEATLRSLGMPTMLYLDTSDNRRKSADELFAAQVLITTLQTFGNRFKKGVPKGVYGLVYIEECDQLFSQYARSGARKPFKSQVSEAQAKEGFNALYALFQDVPYIWGVDATMTVLSSMAFEGLKKPGDSIRLVRNTREKIKAPVTMLPNLQQAYVRIAMALDANKRVVVAADTAGEAKAVYEMAMLFPDLMTGRKGIVITGDDDPPPQVVKFMSDVNAEAAEYDLVVYNSAMASGVSIDGVKPDVVVQIAGYLTPRVNLQMANRYRLDPDEFYVFYKDAESLFVKTDSELREEALSRAQIEATLANLSLTTRTRMAELRSLLASVSIADVAVQFRAPRQFYLGLLEADGRTVDDSEVENYESDELDEAIAQQKAERKEHKEWLAKTWRDTPIIDDKHKAPAGYTEEQKEQGRRHGTINWALREQIPEGVDNEEINRVVMQFVGHISLLKAFAHQEETVRDMVKDITDTGKALMSMANRLTQIEVISAVKLLWNDFGETLTPDDIKERAPLFLSRMMGLKDKFDTMTDRAEQKYAAVVQRETDEGKLALEFSRQLLKHLGLKQKWFRGGKGGYYQIENYEDLVTFMSWRQSNFEVKTMAMEEAQVINAPIKAMYDSLTSEQKVQIADLMIGQEMPYALAVKNVAMRYGKW